MQQPIEPYSAVPVFPLTFSVEYPDRPLNRLSSALRVLWIIPIGIIASFLTSGQISMNGAVLHLGVGGHRLLVPTRPSHDPLSPEVPALVVRLEPEPHQVPGPGRRLRSAAPRRVPVDRRGAGRLRRLSLSRRPAAQSLAAPGQVVPGHPPLDRAGVPVDRRRRLRDHRLVRHPVHGQIPARALHVRRGSEPLVADGSSPTRCLLVTDQYPPFSLD